MILGAGFGQLPAIQTAKMMGLEVICIDRDARAPGMQLADYAYEIDVVDLEGALKIATKHKVDGAMTMQSDYPVPTIGFINDRLGLTGVSFQTAVDCSNKIATRRKLELMNCQQPSFMIVESAEQAKKSSLEIGFPCVIKAPDSSGSRGVVKVKSLKEVEDAFFEALKYTKGNEILVEEYIAGLEFGAQTFSILGTCEPLLLHNDMLSPPPYMIPIGHSFPFKYLSNQEVKQAREDIRKAIQALGIKDGPANVDLILDSRDKRVKIIEIGARIGATCLPELVKYHTGIDWVQAAILSAIGECPNLNITREQNVAAMIVYSTKDGIFGGYDSTAIINSSILDFEITVGIGNRVSKLRKGTDRIGKIICTGNNVNEAEKSVEKIFKGLKLSIQDD